MNCIQSKRISGNLCKTMDTARCVDLSRLSVSNRLTVAANICLMCNAPQSRLSKTPTTKRSSAVCKSGGDDEVCSIQQANQWVIAPGLLAHHTLNSSGLLKRHLRPQGFNIDPHGTTNNITSSTPYSIRAHFQRVCLLMIELYTVYKKYLVFFGVVFLALPLVLVCALCLLLFNWCFLISWSLPWVFLRGLLSLSLHVPSLYCFSVFRWFTMDLLCFP